MTPPQTPAFPYDVFLSHSAKDKAVVRPLAERLRKDGLKDGLKVWLDEWVLKPGDSIPAKIEAGLEHSRVLVLCMSANAFGSDWAHLEAGTFRFRDPLNQERRFIPRRHDDAPIKGSLAQFLYLNWRPADREREYTILLKACREPQREVGMLKQHRTLQHQVGPDEQDQSGRYGRVLIVEDDVALEARPLEHMLSLAGYTVVGIAATEHDAIKLAIVNRPSVVLMDVALVDAKGKRDRFAGLRAAQQIRARTGAEIIFVTGMLGEPDVMSEARKTPGYHFLVKPVSADQLLASVQMAISRVKSDGLAGHARIRKARRRRHSPPSVLNRGRGVG